MLLSSILSEFYNSYRARHGIIGDAFSSTTHLLAKRGEHPTFFVVAACLIPVLVILSGIFAGLTLGYMSLDETQLNVLASSGTPKQREYAKKIIPVRKNGHLLLVSLLLANMVVNETLPVISDEVLGGGVSAVAVSTILIVIFSEIIPQSICTRYGLYIGAKCAIPTRILMYFLVCLRTLLGDFLFVSLRRGNLLSPGPIGEIKRQGWGVVTSYEAWIGLRTMAVLCLTTILGPHHGIIYRRGELKELINMHSSVSPHGGDLKHDTVTIIGHTLDLQEKVVKDAMTPIEKVFMLPIGARLDYETLRRVCESGHSRVPVYEEIDAKVGAARRVKKIVGILLVKQCVLLDPKVKEATPLHSIPLNKVPSVPFDESLLGILDRFQEGRSHMAIVSLFSKGRAASVKEAVKTGLTRRFLDRVGLGEDDDNAKARDPDLEKAWGDLREGKIGNAGEEGMIAVEKERARRFTAGIEGREQAMPADAVLASENADDFLRGIDTDINPLGIITLEDVLEELIGEEILDEFDLTGPQAASSYIPPSARRAAEEQYRHTHSSSAPLPAPLAIPAVMAVKGPGGLPALQFPRVASSLNIFNRTRSQPGTPRFDVPGLPEYTPRGDGEKEFASNAVNGRSDAFETPGNDSRTRSDANVDNEGTDVTTLAGTFRSSDTGTNVTFAGTDSERGRDTGPRLPNIVVSDELGHGATTLASTLSATGRSPSPAPRVTEAILQTQTRRRAQLQQQAHSASSILLPGPGSLALGGELQLPVQLPKGRFKSSPLSPAPPRPVDGENKTSQGKESDARDKVAESDPDLKEPKDGL
ncbi:DUF21-domain-containing protein [Ramaria rubella]|nr:DUF21-domain-containing protein [Ramaria rubella]